MAHKSDTPAQHHQRVDRVLGGSGGVHSDESQDMAMIRKAVHAHEANMHPGEAPTKLARGGKAKPNVTVVINTAQNPPDGQAVEMAKQAGLQQGVRMGAAMAARPAMPPPGGGMPPRPPVGPSGAPPGGMPPAGSGGGMRRGGRAK